jgi:hypothetical protein
MITLIPYWQEAMTNYAFAKKSGISVMTLRDWIEEVPTYAVSYIALCIILHVSPQQLLDGDVYDLCDRRGTTFDEVCFLCGVNTYNQPLFKKNLKSNSKPLTILTTLNKYYSLEQLFDIQQIKADIGQRIAKVSDILCAA